jgi:hypothetical protein
METFILILSTYGDNYLTTTRGTDYPPRQIGINSHHGRYKIPQLRIMDPV